MLGEVLQNVDPAPGEKDPWAGFVFEGEVVKGNQIGRTIGFPTANLLTETVLPAGVFACRVRILPLEGDETVPEKQGLGDVPMYQAMLNVGTRPTLGSSSVVSVEVNLFGFSASLYGRRLRVELVARIRSERKFASLEELKAQLALDRRAAQALLAAGNPAGCR